MNQPPQPKRVAVIGGGISGLAAAHRLHELDGELEVVLFEASDRLGGVLGTERRDGLLIERAADMFITKDPWAADLCRRIGFEDQLIGTNSDLRRSFVVHRGRLCPIPEGFTLMSTARIWPILTTPLFSVRGKVRMAWEYFTPRRTDESDESLASFATRRLGREAYQRLVQPLIGGIYTADPEKLSVAATLPQFPQMEREHGSLIRGMRRAAAERQGGNGASGARYGLFVTPRDGMSSLVDALVARLPAGCMRLNRTVEGLARRQDGSWTVKTAGSEGPEDFDAVVCATPAPRAAALVRSVNDSLADELAAIPHAGAAVVISAYRRDQIEHSVNGFGVVVPMAEKRRILAISFSSNKFAGRAPDDLVLMRTFVGGALQSELAELPDPEVKSLVAEELQQLIGARGEPLMCDVVRWLGAMPQYHVGHLDRVARIEQFVTDLSRFELAGNALRGVGIPFCVRSGEQAAESIFAEFN